MAVTLSTKLLTEMKKTIKKGSFISEREENIRNKRKLFINKTCKKGIENITNGKWLQKLLNIIKES